MDGADLMAVLEERIGLPQLLLRKRRHAAQTGNILLKSADILIGAWDMRQRGPNILISSITSMDVTCEY
jgi:hypothetical protein